MPNDHATKAAREIWNDLSDRKGADEITNLKYDDPVIYREIIAAWATIIRGAIADAT